MALPQQAIEQLAREPVRTPGWSGRLLMFSSTIFLISLFVYLGIRFGYGPYLNAQVKELDVKIASFAEQIPVSEQEKIINFYSQLVNLRKILDNYPFTSRLIGWLEKNTEVNVYFTKFRFNVASRELELAGQAKNAEDASQQFRIFKEQEEVERLSINQVNLIQRGIVEFEVALSFTPRFLNPQSEQAQTQNNNETAN